MANMVSRPKRKATNAHVFRYYYATSKRLEEKDLKRALEASLEECPDYWAEDTASCSSSEQSNATSAISSVSSTSSSSSSTASSSNGTSMKRRFQSTPANNNNKRRTSSASMQKTHLNNNCHHNHNHHHPMSLTVNSSCPKSNVHNRYKPVAKKNIYNEADFFHDGIMEYIEYELTRLNSLGRNKTT